MSDRLPLLRILLISHTVDAILPPMESNRQRDSVSMGKDTKKGFPERRPPGSMETAAYSLGLGCVILGSLLNDVPALIDLLNLPEYTYPVLGIAIGKPDQEPAVKPRMPRSMQFFENEYPSSDEKLLSGLDSFDVEVHKYYDLRDTERPVDAFSDQIAANAIDEGVNAKAVAVQAKRQGFRLER